MAKSIEDPCNCPWKSPSQQGINSNGDPCDCPFSTQGKKSAVAVNAFTEEPHVSAIKFDSTAAMMPEENNIVPIMEPKPPNEMCKKQKPKNRFLKLLRSAKKCKVCGLKLIEDLDYVRDISTEDICRCKLYGCPPPPKKSGCCARTSTDSGKEKKPEKKEKEKKKKEKKEKPKKQKGKKKDGHYETSTNTDKVSSVNNLGVQQNGISDKCVCTQCCAQDNGSQYIMSDDLATNPRAGRMKNGYSVLGSSNIRNENELSKSANPMSSYSNISGGLGNDLSRASNMKSNNDYSRATILKSDNYSRGIDLNNNDVSRASNLRIDSRTTMNNSSRVVNDNDYSKGSMKPGGNYSRTGINESDYSEATMNNSSRMGNVNDYSKASMKPNANYSRNGVNESDFSEASNLSNVRSGTFTSDYNSRATNLTENDMSRATLAKSANNLSNARSGNYSRNEMQKSANDVSRISSVRNDPSKMANNENDFMKNGKSPCKRKMCCRWLHQQQQQQQQHHHHIHPPCCCCCRNKNKI